MKSTVMAELISRLRSHLNNSTQGTWTRGVGNQARELALNHGPLLATVYNGYDNTFIVEAHNAMPYLLNEIERLEKELDRAGKLMGTL